MSKVNVTRGSIIFPSFRHSAQYHPGMTIKEILHQDGVPESFWSLIQIHINNTFIPLEWWDRVRPKAGAIVNIGVCPAGTPDGYANTSGRIVDKGTLRLLGFLTSTVAAFAVPAALGIGGVWGVVIQSALSLLGIFLSSTFIPPPVNPEEIQRFSISSARNRSRPYQSVQKHYGKIRVFPDLASVPFTEIIGDEQYISLLLCLGYKPLKVTDIKIGEIPVEEFEEVELGMNVGHRSTSELIESFSQGQDPEQIAYNKNLLYANSWWATDGTTRRIERSIRTITYDDILNENVVTYITQQDSVRIGLDLIFPNGLYNQDSDGNINSERVDISIRYRPVGSTDPNTWVYVYPYWNDPSLTQEVNPLTQTEIFAQLEATIEFIDEAIAALSALEAADRFVVFALREWFNSRLSGIERIATGMLDFNEELTPEQRGILDDLNERIFDLQLLLDSAGDILASAVNSLTHFNSILSAIVIIVEFVDDTLALGDYIARGGGPEISTLRPFHRWLIKKRNLERLFGPPEAGSFIITQIDARPGLFRRGIEFTVPKGQYEVQVRRSNEVFEADNVHSDVQLGSFKSFAARSPVSSFIEENMALMHLRVRATDQINNSVDRVNCIVETPLAYYDADDSQWKGPSLVDSNGDNVSQNPAWAFCDAIRGTATYGEVQDASIDTERILEFAEHCRAKGYYFNGTFDQDRVLEDALQDICRVAKGSLSLRDGMFSVVYEHEQTIPTALLTARNTAAEFSASKVLTAPPDALRIKFLNPDKGYDVDEMYIYKDFYGPAGTLVEVERYFSGGAPTIVIPYKVQEIVEVYDSIENTLISPADYNILFQIEPSERTIIGLNTGSWEDGEYRFKVKMRYYGRTPAKVENFEALGLTDSHSTQSANHTGQVYRLGRTILAAAEWRTEQFSLKMDIERLICERGDLVRFSQDIVKWGQYPARITGNISIVSSKIVSFDIDEEVTMISGGSYSARIITHKGVQLHGTLVTAPGTSSSLTFEDGGVSLGDQTIIGGEHVAIGNINEETFPCLVTEISPDENEGATLTLVRDHPAIHNAEFVVIPDHDPQTSNIPDPTLYRPPVPIITGVVTDESALIKSPNGQLNPHILVSIELPRGSSEGEIAAGANVTAIEAQFRFAQGQTSSPVKILGSSVDQSLGHRSWQQIPLFHNNLNRVAISGVNQGQNYDIRVRSITRHGLESEWAFVSNVFVYGKLTPPPDVELLDIEEEYLVWRYPNRPVDFSGFIIRTLQGSGGTWESATSIHDGVVKENQYRIPDGYGGARSFFVKAVDQAGLESYNAAKVFVADGDPVIDNVILEEDHQALGWPGTIVNMTENSGGYGTQLEEDAGTSESFYKGPASYPKYTDSNNPFYETSYKGCSYTAVHTPDPSDVPYLVGAHVIAEGDDWIVEKRIPNPCVFPVDENKFANRLFPINLKDPFFPYQQINWSPYTGPFKAVQSVEHEFRFLSHANEVQSILKNMIIFGDVRDIKEKIMDFEVADTGTVRLSLARQYRAITNISITVHEASSPHPDAHTAQIVDRQVPVPPSVLGPALIVLDKDGVRTSGIVDVVIQGY